VDLSSLMVCPLRMQNQIYQAVKTSLFSRTPWSSNFHFCSLSRNRGQYPVAFRGKPPASYLEYTSRAQHTSQLHDKFQAAERLRWHPQTLLPRVTASSDWLGRSQQKPVEHQGRNLQTASHSHQRHKENTQCSQGTFADLLSWVGRREGR